MIVALDLDDTLYPEITYVQSGFVAVARALQCEYGADSTESLEVMIDSLESWGRGRQFDDVLRHWGILSRYRVRQLISIYRDHEPQILLPEQSRRTLTVLSEKWPIYLVTDGNHLVQARKVKALGIQHFFKHCYFTNRYGRSSAKPSPRTFELMLRRERADPSELVYVGDNPAKDFVGVRRLGGRTVRVLTGEHSRVVAKPGYEAHVQVPDLNSVAGLLEGF